MFVEKSGRLGRLGCKGDYHAGKNRTRSLNSGGNGNGGSKENRHPGDCMFHAGLLGV